MLRCPKCKQVLKNIDRSYCCEKNHHYDIAKRGYVNLLLGNHKTTGDDKKMVRSRTAFLTKGYYQPLCEQVIQYLHELEINNVIDAGCGEGYYTNRIKEVFKDMPVYGFDLSKSAVDEACKANTGVCYGVCNIFELPFSDASVGAILSIFAPINMIENTRILKAGGYFLKVGPGPRHLYQMKEILYKDVYENETNHPIYEGFELVKEELLSYEIEVQNNEEVCALFQMTPYYWKSPKDTSEQLKQMTSLRTMVQFQIELYKKK